MLDNLEALIALADSGSMSRASLILHVSQGAISKRIAQVEQQFGQPVIQPRGRKVELTPFGIGLIERARPLLRQFKELLQDKQAETSGRLDIDIAASVLLPWGAHALAEVKRKMSGTIFNIHTHHASVAVQRVRSGESMIALAQGESTIAPDLTALPVFKQTLVIIPSGLKPFRLPRSGAIDLMTIEHHTEAWKFTEQKLHAQRSEWRFKINSVKTLESFAAIAQLARAGFGHGLAPLGVARILGISDKKLVRFPSPGLSIPVSLIARRSTHALPLVQKFYQALLETVDE